VLISVGGQNGNWASVFSAAGGVNNFATSLKDIVGKYNLDGVDLDIESFEQTSTATADLIVQVKQKLLQLGQKILVVSPQCGTIYQGVGVPDPSTNGGNYWNHFVYIVKTVDALHRLLPVQAYNDWYEFPGGSLQYLQNVYLNWRNLQGLSQWGSTPIANFGGVKASKLVLGGDVLSFSRNRFILYESFYIAVVPIVADSKRLHRGRLYDLGQSLGLPQRKCSHQCNCTLFQQWLFQWKHWHHHPNI
jgi:hypothetical protein